MVTTPSLYALPYDSPRFEDCAFYHAMEIPGHGLVGGADWDLRGGEEAYLGHVELAGRRVLEIGPASGFLTFYMESCGAEVVAVELAPDVDWDIVPHASLDIDRIRTERAQGMGCLRNGFWFAHERFASRAKVYYSSAYDLPPALGHFEVAVMASVLLHTRDPLSVVEGCARLADRIVITDLHFPELDGSPVSRFVPTADSGNWDLWWQLSPDLLVRFLQVMGFDRTTVTFHEQRFVANPTETPLPLFTVVASRSRQT